MIERPEYLKELKKFKDKDLIKVVTGIRRCGKSTLLEIFKKYLIETGIEKALKLKDIDKTCVPELPEYFVAEVEYKEWQEANKYSNYPGAKRTDVKKVSYESHDYMDVLKFIMFCI